MIYLKIMIVFFYLLLPYFYVTMVLCVYRSVCGENYTFISHINHPNKERQLTQSTNFMHNHMYFYLQTANIEWQTNTGYMVFNSFPNMKLKWTSWVF